MEQFLVYYFVFDGLVDYEASYAITAVNNPQFQRFPGRYKISTIALTADPIVTAGGVRILPDITATHPAAAAAAMLILPGGGTWEQGGNMEIIALAKTVLSKGGIVAAICGATLGLAKGGLLDQRRHTSNAPEYLAPSGYHGKSGYLDIDAVSDSNVITAGGVYPAGFAREIAKALKLYPDGVEEAWYQLIKTGDRKYYFDLMRQAGLTQVK